jgi:hypothetical protein
VIVVAFTNLHHAMGHDLAEAWKAGWVAAGSSSMA